MLSSIPDFVDYIYVIDDCSTDRTSDIVEETKTTNERIKLIKLDKNSGVGAAITRGYQEALNNEDDIAVVMAGDGQMHPDDLPALLNPVVEDVCDYAKGNRFLLGRDEINKIPKTRLIGNLVLSMMTKVASGYWHVSDSQSGYTAINRKTLKLVDGQSVIRDMVALMTIW